MKHFILVLTLLASAAHAQSFMYDGGQNIIGIANLNVGGQLYDVTYSTTTENSPFAFSQLAAVNGQAPTAVDAANAINAFYGAQNVGGLQNAYPAGTLVVAAQNAGASFYGAPGNWVNMITASPFYGYAPPTVLAAPQTGDANVGFVALWQGDEYSSACQYATCTVWAPVTQAPELSGGGWAAALTLLAGMLAVRRRTYASSSRVSWR